MAEDVSIVGSNATVLGRMPTCTVPGFGSGNLKASPSWGSLGGWASAEVGFIVGSKVTLRGRGGGGRSGGTVGGGALYASSAGRSVAVDSMVMVLSLWVGGLGRCQPTRTSRDPLDRVLELGEVVARGSKSTVPVPSRRSIILVAFRTGCDGMANTLGCLEIRSSLDSTVGVGALCGAETEPARGGFGAGFLSFLRFSFGG